MILTNKQKIKHMRERIHELEMANLKTRLEIEAIIDSPLARRRIIGRYMRNRLTREEFELVKQN